MTTPPQLPPPPSDLYELMVDVRERIAVVDTKIDGHDRRITSLEDDQKWTWRTVFGTIFAAILGIFISAF